MLKKYLLLIAVALMMVPAYFVERADALSVIPHVLAAVAPASAVQPVYWRGRYYGGRGYYGDRGGASAVATMVASGMVPDDAGTAVAGGPMASAVAGGCLPLATFGCVVENNTCTGRFSDRARRKTAP